MSIGNRILELREKFGLTQSQFAKVIGASTGAIGNWERGERKPKRAMIEEIAKQFNASAVVLEFGEGAHLEFGEDEQTPFGGPDVPLVGKIGAGGHIEPVDDHAMGGGLDTVQAPPGAPEGTVAARIDGDSFYPYLKNGSLVFWSQRRTDIENFLHEMIICHLMDGRKMVKIVTRGTGNTYTLSSPNAAPMVDLQIESVSPIDWMKPK